MEQGHREFVLAEHTTPAGVHWDLMLEMGEVLWTWRVNVPPAELSQGPVPAERIADHSRRFLTYEGPVQNNTGRVRIADRGTYQITEQTENTLIFDLQGTILKGTFSLSKNPNPPFWTLQLHPGKTDAL